MLSVELTPNYLGFRVGGALDDMETLRGALLSIMYDEEDKSDDLTFASRRLMGLCNGLRHAGVGAEHVDFVPSGLDHGDSGCDGGCGCGGCGAPQNVRFAFEVLLPEMYYYLAISEAFIRIRTKELKEDEPLGIYAAASNGVSYASNFKLIRVLQSLVSDALLRDASDEFDPDTFFDLMKLRCGILPRMRTQWLDFLDNDYLIRDKAERKEQILPIFGAIINYSDYNEYSELAAAVNKRAAELGCSVDDLRTQYDWPAHVDWGYNDADAPEENLGDNVISFDSFKK